MINIAFINQSTVVKDDEVVKVVAALQRQVTEHYYPAWGVDAKLVVGDGVGMWKIVILDNSDQAGALGYHDLTEEGLPIGKVFAKTDVDDGVPWSKTVSHELLEMLGDPGINLVVYREELNQLWAYENCDACEEIMYSIDGVVVSDFVFPAWFEDFWDVGQTRFDYCGNIDRPFKLLTGGYIGTFDITGNRGWQQHTADFFNPKARAHVGSRRERRRTLRSQWMLSRPKE